MSVFNYSDKYTFNVGDKWRKGIMKYLSQNYKEKIQLLYNFVIEAAVDGKSHLIKTIQMSLSKLFLEKGVNLEKLRTLLLSPTGIAAININGTINYSGLGIDISLSFRLLRGKQKSPSSKKTFICQIAYC